MKVIKFPERKSRKAQYLLKFKNADKIKYLNYILTTLCLGAAGTLVWYVLTKMNT